MALTRSFTHVSVSWTVDFRGIAAGFDKTITPIVGLSLYPPFRFAAAELTDS